MRPLLLGLVSPPDSSGPKARTPTRGSQRQRRLTTSLQGARCPPEKATSLISQDPPPARVAPAPGGGPPQRRADSSHVPTGLTGHVSRNQSHKSLWQRLRPRGNRDISGGAWTVPMGPGLTPGLGTGTLSNHSKFISSGPSPRSSLHKETGRYWCPNSRFPFVWAEISRTVLNLGGQNRICWKPDTGLHFPGRWRHAGPGRGWAGPGTRARRDMTTGMSVLILHAGPAPPGQQAPSLGTGLCGLLRRDTLQTAAAVGTTGRAAMAAGGQGVLSRAAACGSGEAEDDAGRERGSREGAPASDLPPPSHPQGQDGQGQAV